MKCITHPMEEAIGNCAKCGAGICGDCFQRSEYRLDGKPFCRKCNFATMQELLSNANKEFTSRIIKAIINAVFIGIGLWTYAESKEMFNLIFYMGLGGVPTAWKLSSPSLTDQIRTGIEQSQGDFSTGAFLWVFRLILAFVLGCVISPILMLFSFYKAWKASQIAKQLRGEIANFSET